MRGLLVVGLLLAPVAVSALAADDVPYMFAGFGDAVFAVRPLHLLTIDCTVTLVVTAQGSNGFGRTLAHAASWDARWDPLLGPAEPACAPFIPLVPAGYQDGFFDEAGACAGIVGDPQLQHDVAAPGHLSASYVCRHTPLRDASMGPATVTVSVTPVETADPVPRFVYRECGWVGRAPGTCDLPFPPAEPGWTWFWGATLSGAWASR